MTQPYGYDYTGRPVYPAVPQPTYVPQPVYQQMPQPTQQIRNGGIVSVPNEDEARRYPVAPGYTVTMRDENAPYLYEKTVGYSQLDAPVFRKARIEFEDDGRVSTQAGRREPEAPAAVYAELAQLEALRDAVVSDIRDLRKQFDKETAEIRSLVAAMIKPADDPGGKKQTTRKKEAEEE